MTNGQRKQLIVNAIRDYNTAKASRDKDRIAKAINDMENAFICVSLRQTEGTEKLRQTIIVAKEAHNGI